MSDDLEARGHHAITHDGESYIKLADASVTFSGYRKDIAAKDAEIARLRARVEELEAQNEMLRHATNKLRAMLTELNARHEPLQRAFITAVELLNDAALTGGKDD